MIFGLTTLPVFRLRVAAPSLAALLCAGASCKPQNREAGPLIYCSVDQAFAENILRTYTQKSGAPVRVIYDSEAGKTTGLVERIRTESGQVGADLYWSGEIFNTILLAREGLLAPYESPGAQDIPSEYKDGEGRWTAVALRARVVAYDPMRLKPDGVPLTWEELASPAWARRVAIANPLFGTTRGHIAAMFALWGRQRGEAFLQGLKGNALIADGNSAAVRAVLAGSRDLAMTDSDDVVVARKQYPALDSIYLDMGDGGTLLIPCSVALVRGGRHPEAAKAFYDYLISAEVERRLALSDSRNFPVRESLRKELDMALPPRTRLSFDQIADAMEESTRACRAILLR